MDLRTLLFLKAGGAISSGTELTATGNPVTFNALAKALKFLTVNMSPIQSGSGDPSPENIRPITGFESVTAWHTGKNLLNPAWWNDVEENKSYVKYEDGTLVYQSNTYKASDYVSVMGNTEYTLHAVMNGQNAGGIAFYDSSKQYISGTQINNGTKTDHTFTTPSNAVYMRFWDNNDKMPWNEVMLVYGSTALSEYEPYTGQSYPVTFPALGKNLLNPALFANLSGNVYSVSGDTITVTGGDGKDWQSRPHVYLKAGTYTVTRTSNLGQVRYTLDDSTENYLLVNNGDYSASFTLTQDASVGFKIGNGSSEYPFSTKLMIEKGSPSSGYEPYTSTIYGGSLDLITGVLTATWASIDLGKLTYTYLSSLGGGAFWATAVSPKPKKQWEGYCSAYKYVGGYNQLAEVSAGVGWVYYHDILIKDTNVTLDDPAVMKSALNGVMLVYELDTEQTYQLTPEQITALKGTNTIWSDANGDCEVTYMGVSS